jgi:hypothetical protein
MLQAQYTLLDISDGLLHQYGHVLVSQHSETSPMPRLREDSKLNPEKRTRSSIAAEDFTTLRHTLFQ